MPQAGCDTDQAHTEQLARLKEEVQSLRRQLSQAQRLATVGTLTTMVVHEFNNILTPIINYAQLAQKNPELVGKAIARAAEGGLRASSICKAILGLARGDEGQPARMALRELVLGALEAMARDPHKDNIDLVVDIPAALEVTARRAELQQVILNLVLNARAAVLAKNAPRQIRIAAGAEDGQVRIDVGDNGVGISPENLERIFQPFFTTRGDGGGQPGNGLGLAFCREAVSAMNGQISVRSTPGQGSVFSVHLPA